MDYRAEYDRWLASDAVDEETKEELRGIAGDDSGISDRFSGFLTFGTAGQRGIMRAGINGMNRYTVRHTTQAFAETILESGEDVSGGVTICHDCRHNSRAFACEAASVLAANGLKVNLFENMRPTPELSFAVLRTGSVAGINITASHNTREYNGYKAYWSDGAQLAPEKSDAVSAAMDRIDVLTGAKVMPYEEAEAAGMITILGEETDEEYMANVLAQSVGRSYIEQQADDFEMVYTPFHGVGYRIVPEVLRRNGVRNIIPVPEQMEPDGDFPSVKSPNPENAEGFELAVKVAKEHDVDLIVGTDPDSDRCGVMVRDGDGYRVVTGNQTGVLLIDYLINALREKGELPDGSFVVKSIVSTNMADKVCADNGVDIYSTFTGFKYICGKVNELLREGGHNFIFGYEESIGFLRGTYARDKDGVVATMLLAEMACYYKSKGMSLIDAIESLYKKYGYYSDRTTSIYYDGTVAQEKMSALMEEIRSDIPKEIGLKVRRVRDYRDGTVTDMETGESSTIDMSGSNVLFFELEQGCDLVVRPSGTEPKIKFYALARGDDEAGAKANLSLIHDAAVAMLER